MSRQFDTNAIQKALDWAYDAAVNGIPGGSFARIGTAEELAQSYLKGRGSLNTKVNKLIAWHTTTAATTGFVTGRAKEKPPAADPPNQSLRAA